jgi:general secretion pathway protein M
MKDWFFGLEQRERLMVGVGGVLLMWLLLYLMIWTPIADKYRGLKENVAAQQETLAWMQQAAAQIQTLRRSGGSAAKGLGGRSMLAVVDQSARSGGLATAIKRIEPDGSKGVKVWLEGAAFDPMILWLGKLSKNYRIEPSIITLEPIGNGRVNARLTLLEPAA